MDPALEQLKRLLATLREPPPSRGVEQRLVAEFKRLWPRQGAEDKPGSGGKAGLTRYGP
jgi:hypothetical protein